MLINSASLQHSMRPRVSQSRTHMAASAIQSFSHSNPLPSISRSSPPYPLQYPLSMSLPKDGSPAFSDPWHPRNLYVKRPCSIPNDLSSGLFASKRSSPGTSSTHSKFRARFRLILRSRRSSNMIIGLTNRTSFATSRRSSALKTFESNLNASISFSVSRFRAESRIESNFCTRAEIDASTLFSRRYRRTDFITLSNSLRCC
mmetsp:Transcript_97896/g.154851  ORF Transcript_97896/g.154851 Transcript_97896/m.154851 type:complete len:202 (+) Transcript_97896:381-986(+)